MRIRPEVGTLGWGLPSTSEALDPSCKTRHKQTNSQYLSSTETGADSSLACRRHSVNVYWLDSHVRNLSLEHSLYSISALRPPTLKEGPLCYSNGDGLCFPPFSTPPQPPLPRSLPTSPLLPIQRLRCRLSPSRALILQPEKSP